MNAKVTNLFIGQLARQAGVSTDTIRYYERIGLMPRPNRSPSGYRLYLPSAVSRIQFIQKSQAIGFSLEDIQRILNVRGKGDLPCDSVIRLAEERLADVERQLRLLGDLREGLRKNLNRWKRKSNNTDCVASQFCNLIEEIEIDSKNPCVNTRIRCQKS